MKKLQYLVSFILLLSLGDESQVYLSSVSSIVFLVSAFVFAEEIERRRTGYYYALIGIMIVFNPFFSVWLEVEQIRILLFISVSIFFLLKTSTSSVGLGQPKKEFKQAY